MDTRQQWSAGLTAIALGLCSPTLALADDVPAVSIAGELGGTARYIDHTDVRDPSGFGLNLGARTELNLLGLHLKSDLRYMDGALISQSEDRYFDLSFSGSTPALIFVAADIQEVYYRTTSREGDGLFAAHAGVGFKGKLFGRAKASVGLSYLAADAPSPLANERALGGYVGLEHMLRSKWVDTHLRSTWFVAVKEGTPHFGVFADGDVMVKFPVGPVVIGPRLDVAYRNLALRDADPLFSQQHELSAHLGFAVQWGSGQATDRPRRKARGGSSGSANADG